MNAQTENAAMPAPHTLAPDQAVDQETSYDVLATVASIILVIVFAGVVATQGMDYVADKIERFSDVTSWARR